MDDSDRRFAYRCLPLNIANAHGWELLCTTAFSAIWDGRNSMRFRTCQSGTTRNRTREQPLRKRNPDLPRPLSLQNRAGAFRPLRHRAGEPAQGWHCSLVGNHRDGLVTLYLHHELAVHPRPPQRAVRGRRAVLPTHSPSNADSLKESPLVFRKLSETPDLEHEHKLWSASRDSFNAELTEPGSQAAQDEWQKTYFRGRSPKMENRRQTDMSAGCGCASSNNRSSHSTTPGPGDRPLCALGIARAIRDGHPPAATLRQHRPPQALRHRRSDGRRRHHQHDDDVEHRLQI